MKKTISRLLLVTSFALLLINCEKEQFLQKKQSHPDLKNFVARIVKPDSIFKVNKVFRNRISKTFSSKDKKNSKTITSDIYGFSIDTSKVQIIVSDTYHSYTFLVERENGPSEVLENYVLTLFNDGGYTQLLISYPIIEVDGAMTYDINTASVSYINDQSLLAKADTCPTSDEIIGWDPNAGECIAVNCTAGGNHTVDQAWQCNGSSSQLPHYECSGGWVVTGCISHGGGGGNTGTDDENPYGNTGGGTSGTGTTTEIAVVPLGLDTFVRAELNRNLSLKSPYEVDMSTVLDSISLPPTDSTKIANLKLLCVYNKLATSPTFRNLFTNIFGSNDNLNVTFKVTKDLTYTKPNGEIVRVNGLTSGLSEITTDPLTGEITNFNVLIEIDEDLLTKDSNFNVLKTVIHESIHAYLTLQMLKCNPNHPYNYYDDMELSDVLFLFYDTLCANTGDQHQLIFNKMLPVFGNIIDEIGISNLASQQNLNDFANATLLNWEDFKHYYPMQGLENTQAFIDSIQNDPAKFDLYDRYSFQSNRMSKDCN